MKYLLVLVLLVDLTIGQAANESTSVSNTVNFDAVVIPDGVLAFEITPTSLMPNVSFFVVHHREFLSNQLGERFAIATFAMTKTSLSKVDLNDVIGVLANGDRVYPIAMDGERRIEGRGTLFLHFGVHKFPIVNLETRN